MAAHCANTIEDGVKLCPFLRNIHSPTNLNLKSDTDLPHFASKMAASGPIFEDETSFESAFKIFHGDGGVVPLASRAPLRCPFAAAFKNKSSEKPPLHVANDFGSNLAMATGAISISAFGPAGPFGFNPFGSTGNQHNEGPQADSFSAENLNHEALGTEWLQSGKCPIAKTFRAVSAAFPLVANVFSSPNKMRCPAVIVAARAALAKTAPVKALRPQQLPVKLMAVGALGMLLNMPLGMFREHCQKFSLEWVLVVHAAVPFVAMLRKAVGMPKFAIALTIASCIMGQAIGAKLEKKRLKGQGNSAPIAGVPALAKGRQKRIATDAHSFAMVSDTTQLQCDAVKQDVRVSEPTVVC